MKPRKAVDDDCPCKMGKKQKDRIVFSRNYFTFLEGRGIDRGLMERIARGRGALRLG